MVLNQEVALGHHQVAVWGLYFPIPPLAWRADTATPCPCPSTLINTTPPHQGAPPTLLITTSRTFLMSLPIQLL